MPTSRRHRTTPVVAVVALLAVSCTLSLSDLLATGLLPGATGTLMGVACVYLLTLCQRRRRTVAALLISSWCLALAGSTFLPAPSDSQPLFDLSQPEGCLAYGFALGFGVAAVGRWVYAGSAPDQPNSRGAAPRFRCRRVAARPGPSGRRSRCSPAGRTEGLDQTP